MRNLCFRFVLFLVFFMFLFFTTSVHLSYFYPDFVRTRDPSRSVCGRLSWGDCPLGPFSGGRPRHTCLGG